MLINGVIVIKDGKHTGTKPGKVLHGLAISSQAFLLLPLYQRTYVHQ